MGLTVMLQVHGGEFTEYDKKKRQGPFKIKIGCHIPATTTKQSSNPGSTGNGTTDGRKSYLLDMMNPSVHSYHVHGISDCQKMLNPTASFNNTVSSCFLRKWRVGQMQGGRKRQNAALACSI